MKRMKDSQSIIPKPLQWIPGVIGWLDDCQDLLITALVLARPLLVKLPLRFVPYLGWVLLANDLINLGTGLLSIPLGGRSFKRATLDALAAIKWRRGRLVTRPTEFLTNGVPWMAAVLQGGQALETVTGYGLSLGAAMGFLTSSFWGSIRYMQGDEISISGIPKNDIAGKAFRVLTQSWQIPHAKNIFTQEERDLVIGAGAIASQLVRESHHHSVMVNDWATIESDRTPLPDDRFMAEFQDFLDEEGIPYTATDLGKGVLHPDPRSRPRIGEVIPEMAKSMHLWEADQAERDGKTTHGTAMSLVYNDQALANVSWALDDPAVLKPVYAEFEQDLAAAIEYGVLGNCWSTPAQLENWLKEARRLSLARGLTRAGFEELKAAAVSVCGGFTRMTPTTFNSSVHH